MSDRGDAQFLQVVPRQVGKDVLVNLVVSKRGLVLGEPKASQPIPHVHGSRFLMVSPRGLTRSDALSRAAEIGAPAVLNPFLPSD
jgi:hypothetical protein